MTLTDVKQGFKLWNIGLYKTWFKKEKEKEEYEAEELQTNKFFDIITKIVRMALILMVPLEKWKTFHNLFI
eukprot:9287367-Ditylum_brightwellii.AAC.1